MLTTYNRGDEARKGGGGGGHLPFEHIRPSKYAVSVTAVVQWLQCKTCSTRVIKGWVKENGSFIMAASRVYHLILCFIVYMDGIAWYIKTITFDVCTC